MLKTYLYIPDHLDKKITKTAREQKKSKAEVVRETLEVGFESLERQKPDGVQVLLELADFAKKYKGQGPKDASLNHDYYLWGLPKKSTKTKP